MGALIFILLLLGIVYYSSNSISSDGTSNKSPAPTPAPAREPKKYDKDFLDLCVSGTAEALQSALPSWKEARKKDNLDNETYALGVALIAAALNNGDEGVCKVLIDAGADVNKQLKGKAWQKGRYIDAIDVYLYPLHLAINCSKTEILKLFFDAGAYVNARNSWGQTPLYCAQRDSNIQSARYLESRGATL